MVQVVDSQYPCVKPRWSSWLLFSPVSVSVIVDILEWTSGLKSSLHLFIWVQSHLHYFSISLLVFLRQQWKMAQVTGLLYLLGRCRRNSWPLVLAGPNSCQCYLGYKRVHGRVLNVSLSPFLFPYPFYLSEIYQLWFICMCAYVSFRVCMWEKERKSKEGEKRESCKPWMNRNIVTTIGFLPSWSIKQTPI